jgi:hypothetical protein
MYSQFGTCCLLFFICGSRHLDLRSSSNTYGVLTVPLPDWLSVSHRPRLSRANPRGDPEPHTEPSLRDRLWRLWTGCGRGLAGQSVGQGGETKPQVHEEQAMGEQRTTRDGPRQQRRVVVWGCRIHGTPAGLECQGCLDQGELLTWADIREMRRPGE